MHTRTHTAKKKLGTLCPPKKPPLVALNSFSLTSWCHSFFFFYFSSLPTAQLNIGTGATTCFVNAGDVAGGKPHTQPKTKSTYSSCESVVCSVFICIGTLQECGGCQLIRAHFAGMRGCREGGASRAQWDRQGERGRQTARLHEALGCRAIDTRVVSVIKAVNAVQPLFKMDQSEFGVGKKGGELEQLFAVTQATFTVAAAPHNKAIICTLHSARRCYHFTLVFPHHCIDNAWQPWATREPRGGQGSRIPARGLGSVTPAWYHIMLLLC